MSINIKDVALKSKVSLATVSRVINHEELVKPETVKRVKKVIDQLGYRQNKVASNLRRKNTMYIGLIVPTITYEFFSYLAKYIENFLQKENYSLFLCNTDEDHLKERFYIESLMDNKVGGIIIVSADIKQNLSVIEDLDVPVVLIDRFDHTGKIKKKLVCIQSDHYDGGKQAGEKLIQSGAERLLFLSTEKLTMPQIAREEGFVTAMNTHGIPKSRYKIFRTNPSPEEVAKKILAIRSTFNFDAVFCGNDRVAYSVVSTLLRKKNQVPKEVQVIGFDDIELGRYYVPSISTIRQNIMEISRIAASKMIEMVKNDKELNERIIIPVEYIKRETTQ